MLLPVGNGAQALATHARHRRPCRRAGRRARRRGPQSCRPTLGKKTGIIGDSSAGQRHDAGADVCPDDGTLAAKDRSHVVAGLWAIDTVNPNAWPSTMEYLQLSAADLVVTQEPKVLPGQPCADSEAQARQAKWALSLEPCLITEAAGKSAGVTVGARSHIGVSQPAGIADPWDGPLQARFRLRHIGAVCRGGLYLGSAYLHDSVGVTAQCNLDLLHAMAAELRLVGGCWIVGGDWNCTPAELAATGWLELVDGIIHAPQAATCNDKIYDYFVVKAACRHAVHSVHTISDAIYWPHSPVRLLLRSAPRCIMVRSVCRPLGFRAVLPFGPDVAPPPVAAGLDIATDSPVLSMDVDAEYAKLLSCFEASLSALAGHDAEAAAAHSGRADGPTFRWRSACGPPADRSLRSTPVSRAWRRVANWFRILCHTDGATTAAAAARWRILHYDHRLPPDSDAGKLEAWLGLLHDRMLQCAAWVRSLGMAAAQAADQAEAAAAHASRVAWTSWLTDGPAQGLRQQHRMSRTSVGWISTHIDVPEEVRLSDTDTLNDTDEAVLKSMSLLRIAGPVPLNAQQVAEREAGAWATEWGAGQDLPEVTWPADLGPLPQQLTLGPLKKALAAFPAGTGLGWDDLHPRALLRLDDELLMALLRLLFVCESQGRWPRAVALVIIALLPKPDGGRRPIGLFPLLPRIWMKMRRAVAEEWERCNARPYLYAGTGKGADVAAWKQAARAELAQALPYVDYGQVLLDLVKAFERVPHHILVREARRLGYSLWVLRLALAAYRLARVVRVDGVVSRLIFAMRGITAGSGLATTEMRILLIKIVDSACRLYPAVAPTLFVDDLSAEVAGTRRFILQHLVPFVLHVCDGMSAYLLEVSRAKSVCTASTDSLGSDLAQALRRYGIRYERRVKSLGTALGAGVRKNARVASARLRAFKQRLPRFRRIRAAGISTARLLRTGGIAAMTFGQAAMGVAPSLLLRQRRSAAAAAAPARGTCGQSLDLALLIADETRGGKADPAFDAHTGPIGHWAKAVWEKWLPVSALQRLVAAAESKLSRAARPWAVVRGPGAALLATASRLAWTV